MNLESLSLEAKQQLLVLALEKKKSAQSRKIDEYRPHSGKWRGHPEDGQEAFHRSLARIRVLLGGNQSGKTIAGILDSLWYALGIHPYKRIKVPNRGRIVASLGFEEGAGQVIVPKLFEWLPMGVLKCEPRNNQAGVPSKWEFNNGSVINILSGEQDPKVFEGWTGDWAWVDEPCRRDIFEATRRGLLKQKGNLWMTMTPLSEPWIYNDLWLPGIGKERTDINCFTIDMWDNCVENGGFLDRKVIEDFEKDLPEDVRETRIHGKFRHLSGRVYPMFDPQIHVVPKFDIPQHWQTWEGIDPHLRKPHAWCQWCIDPKEGDIYVSNEIYEKVTMNQLADLIIAKRENKQPVETIIDTSAETPSSLSRETPRRTLERKGIRTRLAKKYDNVLHGIELMRDLLTPVPTNEGDLRPKFYVMEHCKRHIKEFLNYVQDDRDTEFVVKDKPRKVYDDMMDLDRYLVVENPTPDYEIKPIHTSTFRYGRH